MSSPSAPAAPDAAATDADPAVLEMADVVAAIFRMLDDNIDTVLNAAQAGAPADRGHGAEAGGASSFLEAHAPVPLVGVHGGGHGGAPLAHG